MAQRFNFPKEQVFSNLGTIGAGFKLETYEVNTTTPLATFSDVSLNTANTNPLIADSAGRFGDIFVNDLKLYKAVLKDSNDNIIWTADPVDPKVFSIADFDPRPTSFWGATAGTSAAFTLAADPAISSYSATQTFYFACHLDCADSPTMAISSLTALNLKKYNGANSKVNLEEKDILSGQRYHATIDGSDIIVLNPESQNVNILTGSVVPFFMETAPLGWLECDGSAVSRTTYAALFSRIGTTAGIGDGSTTFNLPDLRGQFIRGWDHGAGSDPDAGSRTDSGDGSTIGDNVGTKQATKTQPHKHGTPFNTLGPNPGYNQNPPYGLSASSFTRGNIALASGASGSGNAWLTNNVIESASSESRPPNVYLMYCIKT